MGGKNVGDPVSPCPLKKADVSTIELEFVDDEGKPVSGIFYRVELPDESVSEGYSPPDGKVTIEDVEKGSCTLSLPELHKDSWSLA